MSTLGNLGAPCECLEIGRFTKLTKVTRDFSIFEEWVSGTLVCDVIKVVIQTLPKVPKMGRDRQFLNLQCFQSVQAKGIQS